MSTKYAELLAPIEQFLQCPTPDAWVRAAVRPEMLTQLLTDHLVCELKAAQTAMFLIRRYVADKTSGEHLLAWLQPYEDFVHQGKGDLQSLEQKSGLSKAIIAKSNSPYGADLLDKMVILIKEELHHFYQVLEIMQSRGIEYKKITASRYGKCMMREVRTHEPAALIDKLICCAYIEARSCERFARLAPHLDPQLERFYTSLLRSEARHYQDYLSLAQQIAGDNIDISPRIAHIGQVEAKLIQEPESQLRFHSGVPY